MKKNYYLRILFASCSFLLLFSGKLNAQFASQYAFSALSGTYTPLVSGTSTGIATTADTELSAAHPIGFSFVFNGQTVTTFRANSNGVVSFHATGNSTGTNNLATATATQRLAVAPLWDDLQCTAGVTYELSGSAPNRVLTVEFKNMEWNWNSVTPAISFQVKLYETTNVIDFIYQQEATAINNGTASIGIMGSATTDYISLTDVTAAPVISTTASTNNLAVKPATGQIYRFTPPAPTADPSVPTQAATTPDCIQGTELILAGTPPANTTWYWQTSATGTSTATPHVAPYYVIGNNIYYVRAYNSVTGSWSNATSIVVSNFTYPAAPAAPTAAQNPACATTGTTLSAAAAPGGVNYFWQGTTALGTSTTQNASTPLPVSATGTYYVRAQDATTMCWSTTASSVSVTIDTYIPGAPVANPSNNNICAGTPSQPLVIDLPATSGTISQASGSLNVAIPDNLTTGTSSGLTIAGIPAGATITNVSITVNVQHTWAADVDITLTGPNNVAIDLSSDNGGSADNYTNTVFSNTASTNITAGTAPFTGTYLPEGNLNNSISIPNGLWTLKVADDLSGDTGSLLDWAISVSYTLPASTISWYDAATGGNVLGTGTPFESVGTSVLPNTNTGGVYNFYAEAVSGACSGSARTLVTVSVTEVLAVLTPVNVTCNGAQTGSFTLGTVQCGTAPFLYSVDGGAFGPIPTNLTAGTHSVIMQDAAMGESAPITVVITEPGAPQNLNTFNVTYFNGQLTWTPQGDETSWNVEYGPAGFTPGSSPFPIINATNDTVAVSGLTENTTYEFYVQAGCTASSDWAGPFSFTTDPGFLAWDNECPAIGFFDISGTGTDLNLVDDGETGITLPFAFPYQGGTVTDLTVGNNGGIQLNTLTGAVGYGGNMTTITGDYLFAWGDDMDDETGNVYYQVTGTAPNQIAIFQWNNQNNFSNGAGTVTFQIQMHQATGEIYYVYDDAEFGGTETADDYAANADIGLSGPTTDINVSNNNAAYLQNNSCVHFYYALCPNVQNMVVIPAANDAQLNWDAGLYGETEWTLIYGPEGFDPTIPGQATDTFDLTLSETNFGFLLQQMTTYDVYIYSECQADNLTSDGFFVQFTTLPYCADITSLVGATDADSLELTWNWTESSPAFPVTGFNIQYGMTGFALGSGFIEDADGINFADTVFNAQLMASGVYQVYVQAECAGTTDTSNWVGPITVIMPATNDIVCSQEALLFDTDYTFNTTGAGVSANEANIAPPATGAQTTTGWVNSTLNGTLWYSFVAPATGQVRINSTANNFNSQAAVYSATNCADFNTFTLIAANDDAIGGTGLAPNFTVCSLTPGTTYYLMVDKFTATNGNFAIRISDIILNAGTANPVTNVCTGDTVNLFNTISGYQAGGVWSSSIPAVNISINDSLLMSEAISFNTYNLQYRVTDGCAYDSIISQVKLFPLSNAGQDGVITACKNEPIDLLAGLNGMADLNGSWYDPSNVLMPSSQLNTANFPGQYNYDYIAGNGVCPDDTANVVVTVLGTCNWLEVDENALELVTVYPNPSTGVVFVESTFSTGSFELVVTDVNGRAVQISQNTISAGTNTVDLKGVERGTYFFKLSNDTAEKVFRVVIQ